MRIINPGQMAADLRAHKIGKKEYWFYAAAFVASICVSLYYILFSTIQTIYEPAYLKILNIVLVFILNVGTVFVAYVANKKGDRKDFWYRYVGITFPIGILLGLAALCLVVLGVTFEIVDPEVYAYKDFVFEGIFAGAFFYFTWKYMSRIASRA